MSPRDPDQRPEATVLDGYDGSPDDGGVDGDYRISDADRQWAMAQLEAHCGSGRLNLDELVQRCDAVRAAVTRSELDLVLHDLPDGIGPARRGWQDRGWRTHAAVAALTTGGVIGLWQLTRDPHPRPADYGADYWWPLWFGLIWAVVVLLHYLHAAGLVRLPARPPFTGEAPAVRPPEHPGYPAPPSPAPSSVAPMPPPHPRGMPTHVAPARPGLSPDAGPEQPAGFAPPPAAAGDSTVEPADGGRPPPTSPALLDALTEREREVLILVAEGCANKEIARRLFISERTARTHVSHILRKLELPSRTHAALLAVRAGLTTAPPQI